MKRIIAGRGTGKTLDLFKEAARVNGTILCEDVPYIKRKMYAYGYNLNVLGYDEYQQAEGQVFVRDLEKFTEYLLKTQNFDFAGYTLTTEN